MSAPATRVDPSSSSLHQTPEIDTLPSWVIIAQYAIRLLVPLLAAGIFMKFAGQQDQQRKVHSSWHSDKRQKRSRSETVWLAVARALRFFYRLTPPKINGDFRYTSHEIISYRRDHRTDLPPERPAHVTATVKAEVRRQPHGQLAHPRRSIASSDGSGDETRAPLASGALGTRTEFRSEPSCPPKNRHLTDDWLPVADPTRLGVPTHPNTLVEQKGLSASQALLEDGLPGGLISAAAYHKMRSRKNIGVEDIPPHLRSPAHPVTAAPSTTFLSLQQALANSGNISQVHPVSEVPNALRALTPLPPPSGTHNGGQPPLLESPILTVTPPQPLPQVARQAISPPTSADQKSPPTHDASPDFITANRDAVIELRRLLVAPSSLQALAVYERLTSMRVPIAPQTYNLLVTVAISSEDKKLAEKFADGMRQDGYPLGEALSTKLATMSNRVSVASSLSLNRERCTPLTANAPIFTPQQTATFIDSIHPASTIAPNIHGVLPCNVCTVPPAAPAWLLPDSFPQAALPTRPRMSENIPAPQNSPPPRDMLPLFRPPGQGPSPGVALSEAPTSTGSKVCAFSGAESTRSHHHSDSKDDMHGRPVRFDKIPASVASGGSERGHQRRPARRHAEKARGKSHWRVKAVEA